MNGVDKENKIETQSLQRLFLNAPCYVDLAILRGYAVRLYQLISFWHSILPSSPFSFCVVHVSREILEVFKLSENLELGLASKLEVKFIHKHQPIFFTTGAEEI